MTERYSGLPDSEWMLARPPTAEQRAHSLALELLGTTTTEAGLAVIERRTGLTLCLTNGRVDFAGLGTVASLHVIDAWSEPRLAELRAIAASRTAR